MSMYWFTIDAGNNENSTDFERKSSMQKKKQN